MTIVKRFYNSYRKQGMSKREARYHAVEEFKLYKQDIADGLRSK